MTEYASRSDSMADYELLRHVVESEEKAAFHAGEARAAREEYLHRRREVIARAYATKGDSFGVVRVDDAGYVVELNTPRRVEWDQDALAALQAVIRDEWKADPDEYIEAKLSVKESKYKAWPSELRARFEPARFVKPGSPSLTITVKE